MRYSDRSPPSPPKPPSPSPPPPSPPPPPPPPPPALTSYTFTVIAEGTVADFDSDKVDAMKASVAAKADVATTQVSVSVVPASVHIVVNIKTSEAVTYAAIA